MIAKCNIKVGDKYNRLTIVREISPIIISGQSKRMFCCECSCSEKTLVNVMLANLRKGNTKSCGCLNREVSKENLNQTTHGLSKHPLYSIWYQMNDRCLNPNNEAYNNYGGRGIKIYKSWSRQRGVETGFNNFLLWESKQKRRWKKGLQIDRIDNDLGYYPSNCRFVAAKNNCNNRRISYNCVIVKEGSYKGLALHCAWKESKTNLSYSTVIRRFHRGLPIEECLAC
jgi:hypothetical protein